MSASKQKGTGFETLMLDELRLWYPGAERRAMQGRFDKGDHYLPGEDRFALESKNVARLDLAGWCAEAEAEARNAGVPFGVVLHKRKGKGRAADQWVTTTAHAFFYIANVSKGT